MGSPDPRAPPGWLAPDLSWSAYLWPLPVLASEHGPRAGETELECLCSRKVGSPLDLFETHTLTCKSGNGDISMKGPIVWQEQKKTPLVSVISYLLSDFSFLVLGLREKGVFENVHSETTMV